jgi:hypothetical protein
MPTAFDTYKMYVDLKAHFKDADFVYPERLPSVPI